MRHARTLLALIPLALAACGGGDDPAVSVDGAWARASAAGQTTGAVYFDLEVADDDTLLSASVPDSVAAEAQIHEVVEVGGDEMSGETSGGMTGDDTSGSHDMGDEMSGDEMSDDEMSDDEMSDDVGDMDMGGAMRMQELVDGLPLTGGETVSFAPGGYHVMLMDLVEPLVTGDEFELTLDFANAGTTTVTVEVAENAP